jgi:hypothetical protein
MGNGEPPRSDEYFIWGKILLSFRKDYILFPKIWALSESFLVP